MSVPEHADPTTICSGRLRTKSWMPTKVSAAICWWNRVHKMVKWSES